MPVENSIAKRYGLEKLLREDPEKFHEEVMKRIEENRQGRHTASQGSKGMPGQALNGLPLNKAVSRWLKPAGLQDENGMQNSLLLMLWMLEQDNQSVQENGMDSDLLSSAMLRLMEMKNQQIAYQVLLNPDAPSPEDLKQTESDLVNAVSEADSPESAALLLLSNLSDNLSNPSPND